MIDSIKRIIDVTYLIEIHRITYEFITMYITLKIFIVFILKLQFAISLIVFIFLIIF
jgi:hypothetical protein